MVIVECFNSLIANSNELNKFSFLLGLNKTAELLIKNGANVNFVTNTNNTALYYACGKGMHRIKFPCFVKLELLNFILIEKPFSQSVYANFLSIF